jgi:hypothetical protein
MYRTKKGVDNVIDLGKDLTQKMGEAIPALLAKQDYAIAPPDEFIADPGSPVNCGNCKFMAQGEHSSFCDYPKQTNPELKDYVYYNWSCKFFLAGTHPSRPVSSFKLKE